MIQQTIECLKKTASIKYISLYLFVVLDLQGYSGFKVRWDDEIYTIPRKSNPGLENILLRSSDNGTEAPSTPPKQIISKTIKDHVLEHLSGSEESYQRVRN